MRALRPLRPKKMIADQPAGREPLGDQFRIADLGVVRWSKILFRTSYAVHTTALPVVAQGIAFSAVMALLPGIVAFIALYGLFADAARARENLQLLAGVLPPSSLDLIGAEMVRIANERQTQAGLTFFLALGAAFVTANTGMRALFRGLNSACELEERRSGWRINAASSLLTVSAFLVLLATASALVGLQLLPLVPSLAQWAPVAWLRWPLLAALIVVACECIYRLGPSRPLGPWRWYSAGSLVTAAIWLACSLSLGWYVSNVDNFNAVYGSLGAIFAILIWAWLSAIVVLVGARLNLEIERELRATREASRSAAREKR